MRNLRKGESVNFFSQFEGQLFMVASVTRLVTFHLLSGSTEMNVGGQLVLIITIGICVSGPLA